MKDRPATEHEELKRAVDCLSAGYFEGALNECRLRPVRRTAESDARAYIAWTARVLLGGRHRDQAGMTPQLSRVVFSFAGGQGAAEAALWLAHTGHLAEGHKLACNLVDLADRQHGRLVMLHASAAIELATIALHDMKDADVAFRLTNCALGHPAVLPVATDLDRLAALLAELRAPLPVWGEWGLAFLRHIQFASVRRGWAADQLGGRAAGEWAAREDDASEGVLRRALQVAPRHMVELLIALAPHQRMPGFADVLRTGFATFASGPPEPVGDRAPPRSDWWAAAACRSRFQWHDSVTEAEQGFVQNGEWAMMCTPTQDYSMALSQWWRAVEAILKRSIGGELQRLFAAHPEWEQWDRDNLSEKRRLEETLFLRLTDDGSWNRLTLGDLLLILKKVQGGPGKAKGLRLRAEAAIHLRQFWRQFGTAIEGGWLRPAHLTVENIDWFRNRAAHNTPCDVVEANVGRLLASQLLGQFFGPSFVPATIPLAGPGQAG